MFSTFSHRLSIQLQRFSIFWQNMLKVVCCRIVVWGKGLTITYRDFPYFVLDFFKVIEATEIDLYTRSTKQRIYNQCNKINQCIKTFQKLFIPSQNMGCFLTPLQPTYLEKIVTKGVISHKEQFLHLTTKISTLFRNYTFYIIIYIEVFQSISWTLSKSTAADLSHTGKD